MGNFLDNVIDWGFSRERYWGTPLPIWVCPDCGGFNIVGSWKSNQNTLQLTMEIDSDTTINGNVMSGVMSIPLVISSTNSSGIIIPPTNGFTSFELTDEEGNRFSGESSWF